MGTTKVREGEEGSVRKIRWYEKGGKGEKCGF